MGVLSRLQTRIPAMQNGELIEDFDPTEVAEWLDSLDDVIYRHGPDKVRQLLAMLQERAYKQGVTIPFTANTPYINTIHIDNQPTFPGNREIERRIKSYVRWNAMAMVVRASKRGGGVGGHISTYQSAATLLEVGFNHFFRGPDAPCGGDQVYFQGHASPGMYARAFLEGRLSEEQLDHFRHELDDDCKGLSSYPHPWLMPDFWQFPTVSMGLGPITAIYQARFNRYLHDRGLADTSQKRVWCYVGDGEVDEPETLGALTLASREKLDNLTFVVNCNLQRLDGPVRGNGKIIQELEAAFRGAGWKVFKVIWGTDWDTLIDSDETGALVRRMGEIVDGQFQKYSVESGAFIRDDFFNTPELKSLVEHLSDTKLQKLRRGGHDPEKVYAAYKAATEHKGSPTVILAKTIKGYGLGDAGEGLNITHQLKSLDVDIIRQFRDRFGIPISDEQLEEIPYYKPAAESRDAVYLRERRQELGGSLPCRRTEAPKLQIPTLDSLKDQLKDTGGKAISTTMGYVKLIGKLLRDKNIGKYLVPIIPDEARTFGMEGLFKRVGIYAHSGQLYEPVDANVLASYREAKDGQVLEEGINEAGSMASFVAAGTAYANHGVPMIPFYIYYSMFGFQRIGDLAWLAGDSRCRGFMLGATAGRTSLNGEGLQHQDGHSPLLASTIPNVLNYDPAYAYETTVVIQDGLRRMFQEQEDIYYYITLYNDPYAMPAMPEWLDPQQILKGMYCLDQGGPKRDKKPRPQLLGSGSILPYVVEARDVLKEKYNIEANVWSVTSYTELRRDALACERKNRLENPKTPYKSYLEEQFEGLNGPFIASSDYMKAVPEQISRWMPGNFAPLGTDGFGRSSTRPALRRHFEIDTESVVLATLTALAEQGQFDPAKLPGVVGELGLDPNKKDPATA